MKTVNEYALSPGRAFFDATPKAVWAALAVSFLIKDVSESKSAGLRRELITEWEYLHANGIVPQKAPRA